MSSEPRWLSRALVQAVHDLLVAEHGGLPGIRDEGLLLSALDRPRNLRAYAKADFFGLAAGYAAGLVRDHPFLDGNKRTAFAAACIFLEDNGFEVELNEVDVVERMVALASGALGEGEFAAWLKTGSGARKKTRAKKRGNTS